MSSFISFQIIQAENSEGESHGRKPSQADPNGKDNRKVRTPAFSKRRNTWRHVFKNGGVVPWRGFKPRGLGESLQEGSRSPRDYSGQDRVGVGSDLQTGVQGMERDGQSLQKALGKSQRGVLNSFWLNFKLPFSRLHSNELPLTQDSRSYTYFFWKYSDVPILLTWPKRCLKSRQFTKWDHSQCYLLQYSLYQTLLLFQIPKVAL